MPLYALVDCNNFYVSCERVFNPSLWDKPVVVLSNNDGCIVSRSNEVKALGIKMAEPYYKVRALCEARGTRAFSSNYSLYGDMSNRVMNCLRQFCPEMEVYSIDEAFLDLSSFQHTDLESYAQSIKAKIMQWTGIPVAVGIAPTKTMAKLANHIAKKRTTSGVFYLRSLTAHRDIMRTLDVDEIWGIGRRSRDKLHALGITTVESFSRSNSTLIQQHLGIVGLRLLSELHGFACMSLETVQPRKNILSSRSFGQPVSKREDLQEALANYTAIAAEKLRQQQHYAQAIQIFLRTNPYKLSDRQYQQSITSALMLPSNHSGLLIDQAKRLLDKIYRKNYHYQKVGVLLLDLIPVGQIQHDLFARSQANDHDGLMDTLDRINRQMGSNTLFFAAQGIQRGWSMRRNYHSPHYTTCWQELPLVS